MKNLKILALIALAGFTLPSLAQFEEGRFYLHFKLLNTSYDDLPNAFLNRISNEFAVPAVAQVQFDEPDLGFRITEGLKLSKFFGVEAGLSFFGDPDVTVIQEDGNTVNIDHQYIGAEILAVGQYPIKPYLTAFARGGLAYWRGEFDVNEALPGGLLETHASGVEFSGGLGLRALLGQVSLELAYDQTTVDDMDVNGLTFGIGFNY